MTTGIADSYNHYEEIGLVNNQNTEKKEQGQLGMED